MTDNISRMYELAGIEEKRKYFIKDKLRGCYFVTNKDGVIKHFNNSIPSIRNRVVRVVKYYEKFTSQKQLELIKWIGTLDDWKLTCLSQNTKKSEWWCEVESCDYITFYRSIHTDFSQALAGLVCELWEDLTEEQREEVKKILRC